MTLHQERVQKLFNAAIKLASAEREPFLDKECEVNVADLLILIGAWGSCE